MPCAMHGKERKEENKRILRRAKTRAGGTTPNASSSISRNAVAGFECQFGCLLSPRCAQNIDMHDIYIYTYVWEPNAAMPPLSKAREFFEMFPYVDSDLEHA